MSAQRLLQLQGGHLGPRHDARGLQSCFPSSKVVTLGSTMTPGVCRAEMIHLFSSLLLPHSHPFIFLSYRCTISSHTSPWVYQHRYIWIYIYIHRERERETDQNSKHFIIHYLAFYKQNFFTQECRQGPFFPTLYCVSALLWDNFFLLFWGWRYFGFNLSFFILGGGGQTHPKLFFC